MEVHKPKPWHGLGEFLREYLIVVVGVLTALAAEAVVQRLHESRVSQEAREAVKGEIASDLANAQRRFAWQPCIDRRVAEIDEALASADRGTSFAPLQTIGNPGAPVIATQRWEASTEGGRTSLLGLEEQRNLGRIYAQLESLARYESAEQDAWSDLEALRGVTHPSAELLAHTQVALAHARIASFQVRNTLRQTVDMAARIGVKPATSGLIVQREQTNRELLCLPASTPRDEAAKRIRDPLGLY